MANDPSSRANNGNPALYPHSGIYGRILPSGYAHFADDLQNQKNRRGLPYITTFPSGWDENVDAKERYPNLDPLQDSNGVYFAVYTSGISFTSASSVYTVTPNSTPGTMSKLFGSSDFSNSEKVYDQAASGKFYFDASGFKNQGSVLARSGESFMFTNSFAANAAGGFNLRDATPPFQYKVQYSGVSDIFNSVIYRYRTPVQGIASGVYVYPPAPSPPSLPTPPQSEPPSPPPDGPPDGPPAGPTTETDTRKALEGFPEFLLTIDPDWAIKIED
jgi:hypothetical protein